MMMMTMMMMAVVMYVGCVDGARLVLSSNSTFRIVQIADLHFGEAENTAWGPSQDKLSLMAMEQLFQYEKEGGVDLVVLSGDQLTGLNIQDNATKYWGALYRFFSHHTHTHTHVRPRAGVKQMRSHKRSRVTGYLTPQF